MSVHQQKQRITLDKKISKKLQKAEKNKEKAEKDKLKRLREKLEREGKGFSLEGIDDPRFMTEYELKCQAIDLRQQNDPSW